MNATRCLVALAGVALVIGYFVFEPGRYIGGACGDGLLRLACFEAQRGAVEAWVAAHPWLAAGGFFGVYVAVTALSIPGAAVMTLAGGALFGLAEGTLLVSFASAIGASLAFVIARFVLQTPVQRRFGRRLETINRGVERDGAFYLFALRLVPVFPFFVINLAMALTPMTVRTFYLVSQAGMLPGTLVYVNAGTQLGQIESLSGVLSPGLIASFVLLGVFPLLARKVLDMIAARKALRGHRRPKHFDRNLIVIGAGSAGLVAALIAATVKARVTLIERNRMGGDCLNTGCVPSKALIRTARLMHEIRHSARYGIHTASAEFSFADVMARVKSVIATIAPHDSVERYESLGVDCIQSGARLVDPWTVETDDGSRLSARHIVLATGAVPFVPPIPGLAAIDYLTSDNLWDLDELPPRLAVLGAGPIGCEMAQAFARLGSEVTLIEQGARILSVEDADIAATLDEIFAAEGVTIRTGHEVIDVAAGADGVRLTCRTAAGEAWSPAIGCSWRWAGARAPKAWAWKRSASPATGASPSTHACRPWCPRSMPAAMPSAATSSPMRPRTRPGTPPSMRCSGASSVSRWITARCPGAPSRTRRSRMSATTRTARGARRSTTKSPATTWANSTARSPNPPRTGWSRSSPCPARTASWGRPSSARRQAS